MKEKHVAIILAAGQGKRMNSATKKQYLHIQGKPVLYYAISAFENSFIDEIILVTGSDDIEYCRKEIVQKYGFQKVSKIAVGGKERYHSVACGLKEVENADYIYIHDGARPFVSEDILKRAKTAVQKYKACVVGMPVKDTIRIVDENNISKDTPNRSFVWMMQTPQVFEAKLVKQCYEELIRKEEQVIKNGLKITDDVMVVEHFSDVRSYVLEGSYTNIKITTPEDLLLGESILNG